MSSLSSKQGPRYRHTADSSEPYETIGVEKLTPIIGAEISGVDLASTPSNRTMDEIHRALAENLVIFFRDQHLTPRGITETPPIAGATQILASPTGRLIRAPSIRWCAPIRSRARKRSTSTAVLPATSSASPATRVARS